MPAIVQRPHLGPRCYQCIRAVVGKGELVRCEHGYFHDKWLKRMGYKITMECKGTRFEEAA